MKKIGFILVCLGLVAFVACGDANNSENTNNEVEQTDSTDMSGGDSHEGHDHAELVAHTCNDHCTDEAHHHMHGEEGHVCTDACHTEDSDEGNESEEAVVEEAAKEN